MATRISILGATGSVGRSVVNLILEHRDEFTVEAVVGGRDAAGLAKVAREVGARFAAIAAPGQAQSLRQELEGSGIACGAGETAVAEAVDRECDLTVAAIAGTAGLLPTHRAIKPGRRIALANKETLVCAGEAFMRDAQTAGAIILPLDSEHNALQQAMGNAKPDDVESMVITASGGPFRSWNAEAIACAAPEQALAHPNWSMGPKISIDSASMMNKGLEVIEAHHLFGLTSAQLQVVVHPQSIVHGLVMFRDGAVTAGMAMPDMRIPAAHCLGLHGRLHTRLPRLDLAAIGRLDFSPPDLERFPALRLALEALEAGGGLPTVLNAANEIAVQAFLDRRIAFGAIPALVEDTCASLVGRCGKAPADVKEALAMDGEARRHATAGLARFEAVMHAV